MPETTVLPIRGLWTRFLLIWWALRLRSKAVNLDRASRRSIIRASLRAKTLTWTKGPEREDVLDFGGHDE